MSAGFADRPQTKPVTTSANNLQLRLIPDAESLQQYLAAWEDLAEAAWEENPFYEPWMLLPALQNLRRGKDVRVLLMVRTDSADAAQVPFVCAVFPLEYHHRYNGLPVSAWSMWKHPFCLLTTPLIRKEHAGECISALFDWLSTGEGACSLLEWRQMPGDGGFHQVVVDEFHKRAITPFMQEWYTRAFFKPADDADRYFSTALSGKHRKQLRRRAELLGELGPVRFTLPERGGEIVPWIDTFLRLEASGWKGQENSALMCQEGPRRFFIAAASEAFRRNRLLLPAILLNGHPIAQNCYFRAGRGVFHFKTAFNEEYGRFSPGFQLECEMVRYLHTRADIDWMDSCTSPDNEVFNRLYLFRRTIQSVLIPTGRGIGRFVVATMPLLRLFKRSLQPQAQTDSALRNSRRGGLIPT